MATNSFTLDDIRSAAEAKYGSTEIETSKGTVELLNPLRLPKVKRDALMDIQNKLDDDDVDQEEVFAEALLLVAKTEAQGRKLLAEVGDDLIVLVEIFQRYQESTQAGEA